MIVTTLPISYVAGRPVRILSSSIVSSILSTVSGVKVCFPLNTVSLRGSDKVLQNIKLADFRECLERFGVLNETSMVFADGSDEVVQNSNELLTDALSSGLCFFQEALISHCECGRVEIPSNVLSEVRSDTHQSMYSSSKGVLVCRICGSELDKSLIQGLFYRQARVGIPTVLPMNHEGRLSGILNSLVGKNFYISRSFRSMSEGLSLDGCGSLDPDFHSALYLVHLWDLHQENLVLVIGINHFYRASRAYAIAKSFVPELDITIVAHPMFSSENNFMSMPVNDAINLMGSKTAVKLLFGTMLQWTRYDSYCSVKDIERVASCKIRQNHDEKQNIPFDETILKKVNRNAYLSLLKKVKNSHDLDGHELALYLAIQ